jgi:hypothetical protein
MSFNLQTAKNAAITTAMVLAVIWAVRRTAIGKTIVTKALAG